MVPFEAPQGAGRVNERNSIHTAREVHGKSHFKNPLLRYKLWGVSAKGLRTHELRVPSLSLF